MKPAVYTAVLFAVLVIVGVVVEAVREERSYRRWQGGGWFV